MAHTSMQKLQTRLYDLLRLRLPIFQAPMAGAVPPQLIAAVADCGGSRNDTTQ